MLNKCMTAQNYYLQSVEDTTIENDIIFLQKIVPAYNGNFIVVGGIFSYTNLSGFGVVMMVDSNGNMIWGKTFDSCNFLSAIAIPTGCYIGGYSHGYDAGVLVKLDMQGNVVEANKIQTIDSSSISILHLITLNDEIFIVGCSSNNGNDLIFLTIDTAGSLLPFNRYLFGAEAVFASNIIVDDKSFYLLGTDAGHWGYVTRFNEMGNVLWAKKIKLNSNAYTRFRAGNVNADHTINVIYDARENYQDFDSKIGLNRMDSNGNVLIHRIYKKEGLGEKPQVEGISISAENKITILCLTEYPEAILVLQFDENFNQVWSRSFVSELRLTPKSMTQTQAGNLMIAGNSYQDYDDGGYGIISKISLYGDGCNSQDFMIEEYENELTEKDVNNYSALDFDSLLISPISFDTSSNLASYLGCEVPSTVETSIQIITDRLFPNPFNSSFKLVSGAHVVINVYDLAGRLLESHDNINSEFYGGDGWLPGIYIIEIINAFGDHNLLKAVKSW